MIPPILVHVYQIVQTTITKIHIQDHVAIASHLVSLVAHKLLVFLVLPLTHYLLGVVFKTAQQVTSLHPKFALSVSPHVMNVHQQPIVLCVLLAIICLMAKPGPKVV